jgi:hypothetical protein
MRKRVSPLKDQPPLNARQLAYLQAIYTCDQEQERAERSAWSRGLTPRPASKWRWISYHATKSPLHRRLLAAQEVDPGTGSTFEALAARHLILRRWEHDPDLPVPLLFVQITPKGRKLIRTVTGEQREKPLPAGTLREWHWRALAAAYAARPAGLEQDAGGYGHISWRTWLRLRDYKAGDLVQEQRVSQPLFPGDTLPSAYRLRITPFGEAYYWREWARYRALYPDVEAPEPTAESERRL